MAESRPPHLESEHRGESGPGRLPFGIARAPGQRVEIVFALRQGGTVAVIHELGSEVTAESLERYCAELRQMIAAGRDWGEFADAWSATGQRAFVQFSEVVGFSARPAR
jgi:hypothetical protein